MTASDLAGYKEAIAPLLNTYSEIISIETSKLIHVSGYLNDAVGELEQEQGFFQRLMGNEEKIRKKAQLLSQTAESLNFVINLLTDRLHVARMIHGGQLDQYLTTIMTAPEESIVQAALEAFINGRQELYQASPKEVNDLLLWHIRRIDDNIASNLARVLAEKDLDAYNRWSAGEHESQEVRDYLYNNFSLTGLS